MIEREVILDLQLLRQLPQLARIGLGERGVDADARGFLALTGVQGDAGGHAAPGNLAVHLIADLRLQDFEFTGKVDGDLALLAVDRAEFHRDFETVLGTFTPTIASHRFHARWEYEELRNGRRTIFIRSNQGQHLVTKSFLCLNLPTKLLCHMAHVTFLPSAFLCGTVGLSPVWFVSSR